MKFSCCVKILCIKMSPPSRGAWIEIFDDSICFCYANVAPLAGGVD